MMFMLKNAVGKGCKSSSASICILVHHARYATLSDMCYNIPVSTERVF